MVQEIKFALIYDNQVKNIFICPNYELANQLARASFGNDAFAVETTRYASEIGDKYENGMFYKILMDGTKQRVKYIPTEADNISELQLKFLQSQLALTEEYENKIFLEEKVLNLQQTITNLYEKMEENK